MSELIDVQKSRIKFLSADGIAAPELLPMSAVPIECGARRMRDLERISDHPHCTGLTQTGCDVIVLQSVYKKVNDHLREDTRREHGGFLLGFETTFGESGKPAVVIVDSVEARSTEGTPVRLVFTEETWRELDKEIARRYCDAERMPQRVGWYHSHPNIRIFLSTWDLDVCTTYQARQFPVALVVDPVKDLGGFFVGAGGYDPQAPQGFYEAHDMQAASIVTWGSVQCSAGREARSAEVERGVEGARSAPVLAVRGRDREEAVERPGEVPSAVRIPREKRKAGLVWPVASAAAVLIALCGVGTLLVEEAEDRKQIASLEESVAHLKNALPPETVVVKDSNADLAQVASLSIDPIDTTLGKSQRVTFSLASSGMVNKHVVWSIEPKVGSISSGGVYKAPDTITGSVDVVVKATAQSDSRQVAMAKVHLLPEQKPEQKPELKVTVSPAQAKVKPGTTQNFHASLSGTAEEKRAGVKWSLDPPHGAGWIGQNGIYHAPAESLPDHKLTVIATSSADPTKFERIAISLSGGPSEAHTSPPGRTPVSGHDAGASTRGTVPTGSAAPAGAGSGTGSPALPSSRGAASDSGDKPKESPSGTPPPPSPSTPPPSSAIRHFE